MSAEHTALARSIAALVLSGMAKASNARCVALEAYAKRCVVLTVETPVGPWEAAQAVAGLAIAEARHAEALSLAAEEMAR